MGRGTAIALFVIAALVGTFLAYRFWPEQEEQTPAPIEEEKIPTATVVTPVSEAERVSRLLVASLAFAPGQGFPAAVPWGADGDLARRGGFTLDSLLHHYPLLFLELCADHFDDTVKSYTCTFVKKERIGGKLYPPGAKDYEVIKVACREHPFSVFFSWVKKGKLAARALYVEGENDNLILARPFITALPIMARPLDDPQAKNSGRYSMAEFGMGLAIKRVVGSMRDARSRGKLFLRYEGEFKVKELGGRVCYKFVRTPYEPLEEDALNELTIYLDKETWLQAASILRDPKGNVLAEYFFRDVVINPPFSSDQFTRKAL